MGGISVLLFRIKKNKTRYIFKEMVKGLIAGHFSRSFYTNIFFFFF